MKKNLMIIIIVILVLPMVMAETEDYEGWANAGDTIEHNGITYKLSYNIGAAKGFIDSP